MKKYLKPSLFIFIYMSLYLFAQGVITFLYVVIYFLCNFKQIGAPAFIDEFTNNILKGATTALLISALICIPIYYLIVKSRGSSFFKECSIIKPGFSNVILSSTLGASFGTLVTLLLIYVNYVFPLDKLPGNYEEFSKIIMSGNIVIVFLSVGIIGPIIEEIIFRGLILSELNKIAPPVASVIIQGVLFGLYHMQPLQIIYATPVGIVLGLIAMRSKNLWSSIIVHIFFNSINLITGFILSDQQMESYGLPLLLSSTLVFAVSFYFLWVTEKRRVVRE